MIHRTESDLQQMKLKGSGTFGIVPGQTNMSLWAYGNGAPTGTPTARFYFNTSSSATASTQFYKNVSGAWVADADLVTLGGTIATGKTLDTTDADALKSGGVIVPQKLALRCELWPHASLVTRNLFYAHEAWTVTGIVYEPDIAEGTGSVVATVCKCTGNNVAVAATTPMCTAFAVTGTAGTPVTATLTSTAADLVLAATNKIGVIFSGGDNFLDTGRGVLTIQMKRS